MPRARASRDRVASVPRDTSPPAPPSSAAHLATFQVHASRPGKVWVRTRRDERLCLQFSLVDTRTMTSHSVALTPTLEGHAMITVVFRDVTEQVHKRRKQRK